MPHDFVPRQDAAFLAWSKNLAVKLSADAGAYGIREALVTDLISKQAAFVEAYAAASVPATRCPLVVQQKNAARRELERVARECAALVRARRDIPDTMRIEAGLPTRAPGGRSPRLKRPDVAPRVRVRRVNGPAVTVWMIDRETGRHRLPHGVQTAQIFYAVGEFVNENSVWRFNGVCTTRRRVNLSNLRLPPGSRVWLRARWFNSQGHGPFSEPTPARLGDEMIAKRAAA